MRDTTSKYDPELPRISPTQIGLFVQCQEAWRFNYVERIKRPGRRTYFDIGGFYHELLHVLYQLLREGQRPGTDYVIQYMDSRIKRSFSNLNIDNIEVIALVSKMVRDFVKLQSPRIDTGIEVVEVEDFLELLVTLPSGREVVFNGFADLIYLDRAKKLRVRDHKTGKNSKSYTQTALSLNPQLLFYAALYWQISGRMPIDVEVNFASSYDYKKPTPIDQRYKLIRYQHNPHAIEQFWVYMLNLADRMLAVVPVHNYGQHCSSCQYSPLCELNLRGFDIGDMIKSQYEKIDRSYTHELASATDDAQTPSEYAAPDESFGEGDSDLSGWTIPDFGSG